MNATAPPPASTRAFLAAEAAEPVLEFTAVKGLSYRNRLAWTFGLAASGVVLQIAFLSVWPGLPFLAAAMLLSRVVGFDNRLDRRAPVMDGKWEAVPFDRVAEIRRLDASISKWDRSAIDVTSPGGFLLLLVLAVVLAIASGALGEAAGAAAGWILLIDGALLLLSHWFSGIRTVFRQPDLVLKAKALEEVVEDLEEAIAAYGEATGMLLMSGDGDGRLPVDARLSLRPKSPPDPVTGVQGQVVLNRVQGTPYPYFYAGVLGAEGSGLGKLAKKAKPPVGVLIEAVEAKDVEAGVVRQETTRTSGYHVKRHRAEELLKTALALASRHLEGYCTRPDSSGLGDGLPPSRE